jgi:hypothetical protein
LGWLVPARPRVRDVCHPLVHRSEEFGLLLVPRGACPTVRRKEVLGKDVVIFAVAFAVAGRIEEFKQCACVNKHTFEQGIRARCMRGRRREELGYLIEHPELVPNPTGCLLKLLGGARGLACTRLRCFAGLAHVDLLFVGPSPERWRAAGLSIGLGCRLAGHPTCEGAIIKGRAPVHTRLKLVE